MSTYPKEAGPEPLSPSSAGVGLPVVSVDESSRDADRLLTADEVAALLQMTPAWVYAETRRP
jgi:hypothetical protein